MTTPAEPAVEPVDANTRRFLASVGRPLHVLSDPSPVAAPPRPADAPDLFRLRSLAADVRQHTLDHLDRYLDAFGAQVERAGGHVHRVADAAAARRAVADVTAATPPLVVRSPLCDEVGLRSARPPNAAGAVVTAAFLVAESGHVCLASDAVDVVSAAAASSVVCLAGIESVVPRLVDLAVMLKLLARSGTNRPMTAFTCLLDPAMPGRTVHVVLIDNGRRELLAGEFRSVLRCIGCGACTNVCPVYRAADVRPAGLWAGPIGAIVRPLLRPDTATADLPHASPLCGACGEACPVGIDLPAHLIALRGRSPRLTLRLRFWAWTVLSPTRYRWVTRWCRRRRDPWPAPPRQSFHDLWRQRPR